MDFRQIESIEAPYVLATRLQIGGIRTGMTGKIEHIGKTAITCTGFDESRIFIEVS